MVDSGDHKIGTLESIYVDTGTDQAAFATRHGGPADASPAGLRAADRGDGGSWVPQGQLPQAPGAERAVDWHGRGTAHR